MELQAKLNEKYMSFGTYCILSFEGTSYKIIQDIASLLVHLFLAALHRIKIYISRYHF